MIKREDDVKKNPMETKIIDHFGTKIEVAILYANYKKKKIETLISKNKWLEVMMLGSPQVLDCDHTKYVQIKHNGKLELLHRYLLGIPLNDKKEVNHRDHNGLSNYTENLELVDTENNILGRSIQNHDQRKHDNCLSQYKGVSLSEDGRRLKWRAQVGPRGMGNISKGFETEIDAGNYSASVAHRIWGIAVPQGLTLVDLDQKHKEIIDEFLIKKSLEKGIDPKLKITFNPSIN